MSAAVTEPAPAPTPADADAERRAGRRGGAAALASVAASLAALVAANAASSGGRLAQPGTGGAGTDRVEQRRQLLDFASHLGGQATAAGLRGVGIALSVPVGLYLLWLIRRRGGTPPGWVRWPLFVGPVLIVAATLFGFLALKHVSDEFVGSGARTVARAHQLRSDSGTLKAAGLFDVGSRVVFAVWVGVVALHAMRVGLLTSFLGYWGVAAAFCLGLQVPIGDAMYLSWLLSMGILALGYWPGGRPEAWERRPAIAGPAL